MQELKEWKGKTIQIPEITPVYLKNTDTAYINREMFDYKILNYTDAKDCVACMLHIDIWKLYIEEVGHKVDFLFYFHAENKKEVLPVLKRGRFTTHPVYIDTANELHNLNHFSENPLLNCFLLDKENKVLLAGNPVYDQGLWSRYRNIIGKKTSDKSHITTVEVEPDEIELKDLYAGKTSEAIFRLKNTGNIPLSIRMVKSSCGCTVPEWEKQPVASGKSTEIRVRITPEKREYFQKTIAVHCNTESGQILLTLKGMVAE
ncbi:MAG: DUF1573 domain-containing protein [Prevotellaceae bacterium]|nr:DUF1573 domain-containing protein [Prevotellaceae bacterium]